MACSHRLLNDWSREEKRWHSGGVAGVNSVFRHYVDYLCLFKYRSSLYTCHLVGDEVQGQSCVCVLVLVCVCVCVRTCVRA